MVTLPPPSSVFFSLEYSWHSSFLPSAKSLTAQTDIKTDLPSTTLQQPHPRCWSFFTFAEFGRHVKTHESVTHPTNAHSANSSGRLTDDSLLGVVARARARSARVAEAAFALFFVLLPLMIGFSSGKKEGSESRLAITKTVVLVRTSDDLLLSSFLLPLYVRN